MIAFQHLRHLAARWDGHPRVFQIGSASRRHTAAHHMSCGGLYSQADGPPGEVRWVKLGREGDQACCCYSPSQPLSLGDLTPPPPHTHTHLNPCGGSSRSQQLRGEPTLSHIYRHISDAHFFYVWMQLQLIYLLVGRTWKCYAKSWISIAGIRGISSSRRAMQEMLPDHGCSPLPDAFHRKTPLWKTQNYPAQGLFLVAGLAALMGSQSMLLAPGAAVRVSYSVGTGVNFWSAEWIFEINPLMR